MQKPSSYRFLMFAAFVFAAVLQANAVTTFGADHLRFEIRIDPALGRSGVSGRLLIFMTSRTGPLDVIEPDFLDPRSVWISGEEIHNLTTDHPVELDPDGLAFPAPFSTAPAGDYRVMALLDLNHSYTYDGMGDGDLFSAVTTAASLQPASAQTIKLTLSKKVPERKLTDTESVKLVTFESPALTAFWGRPILMRAGVVLPPDYGKSRAHYPTVYVIHGYGGSHATAWRRGPALVEEMATDKSPRMIYVFLDASFSLGHHVFADSVNNGPWGRALTREFIPYLEKRLRMDAGPRGRLLTGHSSGGWSTLWLQVNYPDVFGGTWSTAPDPIDFHNFTGPDLTRYPPQNFYRDADGHLYNLIRMQGRDIDTMMTYALMERVEGYYGGQLASFEAVFGPRGPDGQPLPLFDRDTGRIDPLVQKAWERYDISRLLRTNWRRLEPKLRGKLHVIVGTADTFHLEAGVYLLRDTLRSLGVRVTEEAKPRTPQSALGAGAAEATEAGGVKAAERTVYRLPAGGYLEFVDGRSHFDLYQGGLADRIAQEMYAVARPARRKTG
jgi:enterochelin esterase-like enzyme